MLTNRNLDDLNEILETEGFEPTTLEECRSLGIDLTWPAEGAIEPHRRISVGDIFPVMNVDLARDMARGK